MNTPIVHKTYADNLNTFIRELKPRFVLVTGQPGSGKTKLASAVAGVLINEHRLGLLKDVGTVTTHAELERLARQLTDDNPLGACPIVEKTALKNEATTSRKLLFLDPGPSVLSAATPREQDALIRGLLAPRRRWVVATWNTPHGEKVPAVVWKLADMALHCREVRGGEVGFEASSRGDFHPMLSVNFKTLKLRVPTEKR